MKTLKILKSTDPDFERNFRNLLHRSDEESLDVEEAVRAILQDVRKNGDRALFKYTKKFDRHSPERLEVTPDEIREAYRQVGAKELQSLKIAARRIETFHKLQKRRFLPSWKKRQEGLLWGEQIWPIHRVGIYVPGGLAAYPSTVLMNTIPASVAGVSEIFMASPWSQGTINPYTLVAAHLAGVDRIFKLGGAQAIAALAYGTENIPSVDKIVGPGNIYVATAKRLVFGKVGIDMIAGPTEVVIIADETANPAFIAIDLLSQAEHDPKAVPILITPSQKIIDAVLPEIDKQSEKLKRSQILSSAIRDHGLVILTRDVFEAIHITNEIAPEHLELQIRSPTAALSQLRNAGAVFLGHDTPVAFGDYLAGPNHVLPTSGTARFSSPLGVLDFLKRSSLIEANPHFLRRMGPHVARLAKLEGLTAHAASVEIRLQQAPKSGKRKKP